MHWKGVQCCKAAQYNLGQRLVCCDKQNTTSQPVETALRAVLQGSSVQDWACIGMGSSVAGKA
eukprot:10940036-Prorocentrum_lima.AAC.1